MIDFTNQTSSRVEWLLEVILSLLFIKWNVEILNKAFSPANNCRGSEDHLVLTKENSDHFIVFLFHILLHYKTGNILSIKLETENIIVLNEVK